MLGTVRINGLETQVRAFQKLTDYSKNHSLWRKRLIEAQSWKRGKETAIALIPGVGEELQEKKSLHRGGCGLLQKEEPGPNIKLFPRPVPLVPKPWPAPLRTQTKYQLLDFFVFFFNAACSLPFGAINLSGNHL